jgi:NAD(P)-dependent dehydrogenase (short-subunit alcohol dehydrogenase family)
VTALFICPHFVRAGAWSMVVLVTGGSRGIGLATARALALQGASVAITGTTADTLAAAGRDIEREAAGRVLTLCADVRSASDMQGVCEAIGSRFGGLDALVNNAGVGLFRAVSEMSDDEWRLLFDTNVTGVFNATRAALPHLRARGGGWIVNVSSLSATAPFANGAAYCATKAAVDAFTEALMQEVRHDGIRVASVAPGSVDTRFGGGGGSKAAWALQADDVAQVIVHMMGHAGRSLPSRVEVRPSRPPRKG